MFSEELNKKIKKLYSRDKETMEKLLEGDADTISHITQTCGFTPDMIVRAYEQNKVDTLYKEAKTQIEKIELYHELCLAYTNSNNPKMKL